MCKINVYTTIAENLLQKNKKLPEYIVDEIKDGHFDNSHFEMTEDESKDLSIRIAKVLEEHPRDEQVNE